VAGDCKWLEIDTDEVELIPRHTRLSASDKAIEHLIGNFHFQDVVCVDIIRCDRYLVQCGNQCGYSTSIPINSCALAFIPEPS